jgi:hypothetical protein
MTGLEDQKLAVLTLIHPGSVEKKQKVSFDSVHDGRCGRQAE